MGLFPVHRSQWGGPYFGYGVVLEVPRQVMTILTGPYRPVVCYSGVPHVLHLTAERYCSLHRPNDQDRQWVRDVHIIQWVGQLAPPSPHRLRRGQGPPSSS